MGSGARGWLIGCGLGCLALLVVAGLLVAGGVWQVRQLVAEAEAIEEHSRRLRAELGDVEAFTPPPGPAVPPERLEAFLGARDRVAPRIEEVEALLATLTAGRDDSAVGWLSKAGAGASLIPRTMAYIGERDRALLEAGVNPGEYLYLYALTYYAWLGRSPGDGPSFRFVRDDRGQGQQIRFGDDPADVRREREREVRSRLHGTLLRMLRRQRGAVATDGAGERGFLERLDAEIAALEADPRRLPWQDGLPEATRASLEPFRERLEAGYRPLSNPLEVHSGID